MNNIYVLTPDFKLEGVIDEYVSNIWRPSYSEIGDFELYLGATDKAINLLKENRYVVRSSDVIVDNLESKNITTVLTPGGLSGIPVVSGGNYTDSKGQQWVCDEIIMYSDGTGKKIQRVGHHEVNANELPLNSNTSGGGLYFTDTIPVNPPLASMGNENNVICNCFSTPQNSIGWLSDKPCVIARTNDTGLRIYWQNDITTREEAEEYARNNKIVVKYILASPITTQLSSHDVSKLFTLDQIMDITNDSDCGMSITYTLDDEIEKVVSGESIRLVNAKMKSFNLLGKSIQDILPSPYKPVEIKVSGASGSVKVNNITYTSVPTYEKVMIIKNIQLITDVENGDFLCVTGRELKFLLHQRIVWNQTNLTGTAEESIRRLVNENAITPIDSNRIIPSLVLGVSAGLSDTIEKQVTGEYLDDVITEICKTYHYGWDIFITNNILMLIVYSGTDRSYGQKKIPYVVFSDNFENLYNTDYQLFTEEYANTTLIGGEGEGVDRVYTTVNNELSGLDRYETFTDARDISSNKDSENEIDKDTYLKLLQERGRENLATLSYTEGFSGEVLSDVAFKYGQDFFIGDLVTVINKYGIQKDVRVLSAIESEDESGTKLIPQFNI